MKTARRSRQSGVLGLLLVALLLLGGVLFAFTSLNIAAVRVDRERATNDALAKAKDALIAYAVADVNRPGQLPCPDVNDDGAEDSDATGLCTSLIGRLPWVTLGLADLRDDSGERLWYAVSNDFRTDHTVPPAVPLNSDTAYRTGNTSLVLAGTTPAANLAALVIAPGGTLTRSDGRVQTHACAGACDARDFLDIAAGEDNGDATNRTFVAAPRSSSFNDTLLPVFSDDIMRLVERRAARELAQRVRDHYDMWMNTLDVNNTKGFYPYAATFDDPSTPQVGTNGTTSGSLPLATTPLTWSNLSAGCSTESGGTVLRCQAFCAVVLGILVCLPGPPSARVENVATRFVDPPTPASVTHLALNLGGNAVWTLNAAQRRLDFSYTGFLVAGLLDIRVAAPTASSWVTSSWLAHNNWHQNAGYAVSAGYAIDGGDSCGGAAPSCITIANSTAPNNDKQAIVIMTGRALSSAGQGARPVTPTPVGINQFFEGLNADATLTQFENNLRTATFNDTAVAVRP